MVAWHISSLPALVLRSCFSVVRAGLRAPRASSAAFLRASSPSLFPSPFPSPSRPPRFFPSEARFLWVWFPSGVASFASPAAIFALPPAVLSVPLSRRAALIRFEAVAPIWCAPESRRHGMGRLRILFSNRHAKVPQNFCSTFLPLLIHLFLMTLAFRFLSRFPRLPVRFSFGVWLALA